MAAPLPPRFFSPVPFILIYIIAFSPISFVSANDTSQNGKLNHKSPSCNNNFQLVKVKNWANGIDGETIDGLSAGFGVSLPSHMDKAIKLPAVFADPANCCTNSSVKLSNSLALSVRGDCGFTDKAQVAQSGGAAGLLVINDNEVEFLLYSPSRPVVDYSVIFLWLMAVGTIVCASVWSEVILCEQHVEPYDQLSEKDSSASDAVKNDSDEEFIDISVKGAVLFVVVASTFLLLLYFFMSSWFIWILIAFFLHWWFPEDERDTNVLTLHYCEGPPKGMLNCVVALISRVCKNCGRKSLSLPILGEVSVLSVALLPFCLGFAIFWAATRHASYAWIGQDVLFFSEEISCTGYLFDDHSSANGSTAKYQGCFSTFFVGICVLIYFGYSYSLSFQRQCYDYAYQLVCPHMSCLGFCPVLDVSPWVLTMEGWFTELIGSSLDLEIFSSLVYLSHLLSDMTEKSKKGIFNGYFLWLVIGYGLGLFLTYLGLYLMDGHGQPALLYLVPCTLGWLLYWVPLGRAETSFGTMGVMNPRPVNVREKLEA
ncbi:hypothetical protein IFM89_026260 [Coptis chinensis]|uniref:PA domain-containing protein n=1 Tax=Coptis chinensis TaxID=261450 RepID=A0A835I3L0_9MAGN|nr:hypothetical protein IFM89_026260 [Coptis chinensis]